jgi:hypothetical protein
MGFDFPDVSGPDLQALARGIPDMLSGGAEGTADSAPTSLVLKPKLLENLVFMAGHASTIATATATATATTATTTTTTSSSSSSSGYAAADVAAVCAALFLVLPVHILSSSVWNTSQDDLFFEPP